ncbi:endo-1,4-beta-xylanase [Cohnella cholangitidis]|uniref:Beta-xylanase n=1 Tax=Cohnella cholangitidis TaxID=2598458 RepID=A0A7G5C5S5_9BACL|nr:endo-1,4-beta-xylanase [Cohnella cholangitidis]QMV44559.1 1,4-beta-xylanase [Cohnella cholangitidis]
MTSAKRMSRLGLVMLLTAALLPADSLVTTAFAVDKLPVIGAKVVKQKGNNANIPSQNGITASKPSEQTIGSTGFENRSSDGWVSHTGNETVTVTDSDAKSGNNSLFTSNRHEPFQGPSLNVTGKIHKGNKYRIKVWAKLAKGEADAKLKLTMQRKIKSTVSYESIVGESNVTDGEWVPFTGIYTVDRQADSMTVYLESSNPNVSYYIDDFELTYIPQLEIEDIPRLYKKFEGKFKLGVAVEPEQTKDQYAKLVSKHYNSLVGSNVMKPVSIMPAENRFTWDKTDRLIAFAKKNGMDIRFHTLVWHQQTGEWMFKDKAGAEMTPTPENKKLLLERLETYIRAVVGRYGRDITDWDVVNEIIDPNRPDGLRDTKWYQIAGTDYIKLAFRVTREVLDEMGVDHARLYINDYDTHDPVKRDILYDLIEDLREEGVPIDGVGHQMHVNISNPSLEEIRASIEKFAALGLDNQITELDVSVYTNGTDTMAEVPERLLVVQARRYKQLFDLFEELHENISNVTLWGTDDGTTWLTKYPIERLDMPLLFDHQLQSKFAYWALIDSEQIPDKL